MSRFIRLTTLSASLLLLGIAPLYGDDWPQWLGPKRDSVWRETGILEKFPAKGPKVVWRAPIQAGYAGPAVADGRVYVTDRVLAEGSKNPSELIPGRPKGGIPGSERVLCFNVTDGKPVWKHEYDCPYTVSYPLGPRTTPVIHQGKVYSLGTEGHLFCFDAADGKVHWSKQLPKEYGTQTPIWGYAAHPLIDGQRLICMVGGEGSAVVAFDKDTGKELWKALTAKNIGYCPPTIIAAGGKRQLIIWHGEAVNGLNPETGAVYWTQDFPSFQAMSISTPRVAGDYLFLTSTFNKSGAFRLATDRPAADKAWTGNTKAGTGFDSVFSAPFAEGDHLYGTASDGQLVCLEAASGKRLWQTDKPNGKKLQSADVFIVKNGDRFFLWTEQGNLLIAKLSPQGYEEISRAHLLDPTSAAFGRDVLWCHPAFAHRCLFVRNDKELLCVSLATEENK